jgi:hypothetical protein
MEESMSAHCSTCGADIVYPPGTWPLGTCARCDARAERDEWKRLALDMGEALRKHHDWMRVERRNTLTAREADALLARLERITDSRNGLTSGESLDGIADKNATQ